MSAFPLSLLVPVAHTSTLLAALGLLAPGPRQAGVQRLNDALAQTYLGNVNRWATTSSGRVVFASAPFVEHQGLFVTAIDGTSAVEELSVPNVFPVVGTIANLALTADETLVVYSLELFDESFMLFSVPIDGSQDPVSIGPEVLSPNDGLIFRSSPDSTRAVFLERSFGAELAELHSSPVDGSAGPVAIAGSVPFATSAFEISSDSTLLVYRADPGQNGADLFRVPVDGSAAPVLLAPAMPAGRSVPAFRLAPDASRAVYLADQDADEVYELFSVPLDGSASPVKLNGALAAGGDVQANFLISPDASRVVYRADQDADDVYELFSVPLGGGTSPVPLNGTLAAGGDVWTVFLISPDSSRVVYIADQNSDEVYELFSVPLDGSASPVRLNAALVASGAVSSAQVSADSSRVVYWADQAADGVHELFSVPLDGSASPVRLNAPLVSGGDVALDTEFPWISPDSSRVVYRADQLTDGKTELFAVPIDGSSPAVRLNSPCQAGNVYGTAFGPGPRAVFAAELTTPGKREVLSVLLDGTQPPLNLDRGPSFQQITGDVEAFTLAPDRRHVVYSANLQQDACTGPGLHALDLDSPLASVNLSAPVTSPVLQGISPRSDRIVFTSSVLPGVYSAPIDGHAPPVQLSALMGTNFFFPPRVRSSPDGKTTVFRAWGVAFRQELFSVPTDGHAPAIRLNAPLVSDGDVRSMLVDPRGRLVVYDADQLVDERFELFAVPIDGSAPPRRLSGIIDPGADVGTAAISPDGKRVVYLVDLWHGSLVELFSVPLRAAPRVRQRGEPAGVKLNPTLVLGGNVSSFQIVPGSERVVYLADQEQNERFELFSVPIDGTAGPIKLNAALVAGGDVADTYRTTRDGARVLYVADQETDGVLELFSVPVDGSASPVRLNAPFVPGGDVFTDLLEGEARLGFTRDGTRVLYLADQDVDERVELYIVPIDGSAGPVKLNLPPVMHGDVYDFELSGDGARVVYLADQDVDTIYELFSVPIDGSRPPARVNAELVPNQGQVLSFAIAARGDRVVYRADQEVDQQYELFLKYLPRRVH